MTEATAAPSSSTPAASKDEAHLGWVVAALSLGAGAIHLAMLPAHSGNTLDVIGFAAAGWFQILVAVAIVANRGGRLVYQAAIVGNLVLLGLLLWSRTSGLPWGGHAGIAEEWSRIDAVTAMLEVAIVVVAFGVLLAATPMVVGRLAPAVVAVAALGLATTAISSDEAASHGGAGHGHGGEDQTAVLASIDEERCDRELNPSSYWEEADYLGVDTYYGGAMAADSTSTSGGHSHGTAAASDGTALDPDPTGGRGSKGLDELVTATVNSGTGEGAAAGLITSLATASEDDYDAWRWWLRNSGIVGGGHEHDPTAPDDSGHGSHVGPQQWVAMTDPAECEQLAEEIELARETALAHPTAADAMEAGYFRVTAYVPGIAAHYIKLGLMDGTFEIDQPEMILYDGNGPDAKVVGLSYYILHDGEAQPTQGFTGSNDHYHRHVGLCIGGGGVVGDSTTTEEECAARGGRKSNATNGWMSHAWVVPGCESPWGIFSGATPVLDGALAAASGTNDGACSASAVRDRYGLDDPGGGELASAEG